MHVLFRHDAAYQPEKFQIFMLHVSMWEAIKTTFFPPYFQTHQLVVFAANINGTTPLLDSDAPFGYIIFHITLVN